MKTDDDQIHQCQQNEQSPLIITELTEHKKKTTTSDQRNPSPGWGQA